MRITGPEREAGVRIGTWGGEAPEPREGDFPGVHGRCEVRTEGGRAGIQAGQETDPGLGGEPQTGLKKQLKRRCSRHAGLIWFFPKRALTAARALRSRQAGSIEPPAVRLPHHPLAAFDAFGARDARKGRA